MKISNKFNNLLECISTAIIFIIGGCVTIALVIFAIAELFVYAPIQLAFFIIILLAVGLAEIIKSI